MSQQQNSSTSNIKAFFAGIVILVALLIGFIVWKFIMGAPSNFEENNPDGHPITLLGIIYKGGFIVPLLIAVNLTIITFTIERLIPLTSANGRGNLANFVRRIKDLIDANKMDDAIAECDKQKGSLANVVKSGLERYKIVSKDSNLDKDAKSAAIQKEIEEATSLELPMLSKNLVIISTCASIGTLIGLIGTVFGMIRAFAALANAGAPDTAALATGISEALVNTAFGIIASTIAIIMYNYFSTRIDSMTYSMDEAGYSIVQNFQANN